jgi:hypothetical protein
MEYSKILNTGGKYRGVLPDAKPLPFVGSDKRDFQGGSDLRGR